MTISGHTVRPPATDCAFATNHSACTPKGRKALKEVRARLRELFGEVGKAGGGKH